MVLNWRNWRNGGVLCTISDRFRDPCSVTSKRNSTVALEILKRPASLGASHIKDANNRVIVKHVATGNQKCDIHFQCFNVNAHVASVVVNSILTWYFKLVGKVDGLFHCHCANATPSSQRRMLVPWGAYDQCEYPCFCGIHAKANIIVIQCFKSPILCAVWKA